jgi:hypothetical protein
MLPELGPLVGARFYENRSTEEGSCKTLFIQHESFRNVFPLHFLLFISCVFLNYFQVPEDTLMECCTDMCSLLVHIFGKKICLLYFLTICFPFLPLKNCIGSVKSVSGIINCDLKETFSNSKP